MSVATFFYAPPESFDGTNVRLPDDEAHHVSRVMRIARGSEIQVVDGLGTWSRVELMESGSGGVQGVVRERRLGVGESQFDLRLALGTVKSRSRMDTAIEKAVELGASEITLLECRNSDHTRVDLDRCRRVARAAMKQSLRSVLASINGPMPVRSFLEDSRITCGIFCEAGETSRPIGEVAAEIAEGEECLVLVGPEGGFSDDEAELFGQAGLERVTLGVRRLRTETASIVACSAIMLAVDRIGGRSNKWSPGVD